MKTSELRQIIREEISKSLNEERSMGIITKGANKPGMSLLVANMYGNDTTLVSMNEPFYYNGIIQDPSFLKKLQDEFSKVWDKLTSDIQSK